jgi:hypothetical protein
MENETKQETEEKPVTTLAALAERIEKANAESREILEEQKQLAARNLLGGTINAGVQPPKPVEETPKEYAKRIMTGRV